MAINASGGEEEYKTPAAKMRLNTNADNKRTLRCTNRSMSRTNTIDRINTIAMDVSTNISVSNAGAGGSADPVGGGGIKLAILMTVFVFSERTKMRSSGCRSQRIPHCAR